MSIPHWVGKMKERYQARIWSVDGEVRKQTKWYDDVFSALKKEKNTQKRLGYNVSNCNIDIYDTNGHLVNV